MSIRRSPELRVLLLVALALAGLPAAGADDAAERARLARERTDVEARAKAAEAACAREFAVSACLQRVRAERRAGLQQVDRQRAVLDDAQRKQRAAQRMARVRERQEAAARADAKPAVEVKTRTPRAPAPERPHLGTTEEQRLEKAAVAASAADAQAGERAGAAQRRADKAQSHRDAVEQRNRERAVKKPPARPLDVPAAPVPAGSLNETR